MTSFLTLSACGDPGTSAKNLPPTPIARTTRDRFPMGDDTDPRPLLDRIDELDDRAHLAVTGQLGCWGFVETTLVTSRGIRRTQDVGDGHRVFGLTIKTAGLIDLLKARAESNPTGKGPMAGAKGSLCYVILSTLAHAADPESIPVIEELLRDPEEVISGWAAISVLTMGNEAEDLRPRLSQIRFPAKAMAGARGRGVDAPTWLPEAAIEK